MKRFMTINNKRSIKSSALTSGILLKVKSIGKLDVGEPHARFDERGWETKPWDRLSHQKTAKAAGNGYTLSPKATASILNSTVAFIID